MVSKESLRSYYFTGTFSIISNYLVLAKILIFKSIILLNLCNSLSIILSILSYLVLIKSLID